MENLTKLQFEEKLREIYTEIFIKHWNNYPCSTFYYDHDNASGVDETIGIYTDETTYGFGAC